MSKKLLYVLIFSLSWALLIFVNKLALNNGIKPVLYTIQTTFVSAILLTIYVFLTKKKELKEINAGVVKNLFFIGGMVGIAYIAGIYGLKLSTSVNYGFLIKSTLVFSIIFAFIFLKEKMGRKKVLLLLIFLLGAYLITTNGVRVVPKVGDLLILFAAFCFSSVAIIQKQLTKKVSPEIIGWGRNFFALIVLLFLAFLARINVLEFISPQFVLIVGILSAVLAIYLSKTLSVASVSYMTMMSMSVPVINSLLGILFLKEIMSIFQIIGGILIISSGVLVHKWKI
ncbi:DMT family transporter [Candidatus Microgenomates bacterium]|nr:DMT family transporter [Candidatus Microgenomates bacterium]